MRFVTPTQTIAEYKHRHMPVFETWAAVGAAAVGGAASIGGSLLSKNGSGGGMPSYLSFGELAGQAMQYAPAFTQQNINLQNRVTPGSSQQRALANRQLNSYIQGEIPLDVQQNIQRQVAQNLGGGYNAFSGGGLATNNFARNIGQTSLGLSQFGLSAAPTWQQLANSMVASPASLLGSVMGAADSQYQSQANQYAAQQMQNQQLAQLVSAGIGTGINAYGAINNANYLKGLSSQSSQIPAAQYAGSMVPLSSAPIDVQQKYGWGQFGN